MALRGKVIRRLLFCFCFSYFRFGLFHAALVLSFLRSISLVYFTLTDSRHQAKEKELKSKFKRCSSLLAINGTDTMCLHYYVYFSLSYFSLMGMMWSLATNIRKKLQVATNISYRVSVLSSSPVLLSLQSLLSHLGVPCESGHSLPGSTQVVFTQEIAFFVEELFSSFITDVCCLLENYNFNFIFRLCRHLRKRNSCYYYHVIIKTPRVMKLWQWNLKDG